MGLDLSKLQCWGLSGEFAQALHRIPLQKYMEKVIFERKDDLTVSGIEDRALDSYTLRIFLDKNTWPPTIWVHINGKYAAEYHYFDCEFASKSNIEPNI
jgi:hypothetical protein